MNTNQKYFISVVGEWDGNVILSVECNVDWNGQDAWDDGYVSEIEEDFSDATILEFDNSTAGALILRELPKI